MAKQITHVLIDDLDGKPAEETVSFGVDGFPYEIDLSARNAAKLRAGLAPFIAAATPIGRVVTRRRPTTRGPAKADPDQSRAIRAWAQGKGLGVSDRGRIRVDIVERYHAEAGR